MIDYVVELAHGNPFAFVFIVGTVVIVCLALLHPEHDGGDQW